ncbi:MAG TPA: hypothetical protein VFL36_03540 [Myxococcales bacterium]|nr:hypothetical protein [Myxococcales bacterium]
MRCPVCDTENPDAQAECGSCGKALRERQDEGLAPAPPLEGLLPTVEADRDLAVSPEIVPDLERTSIDQDADAPLSWTAGPLALERTALAADPDAVSSWTGGVELDPGRERDAEPRTPAPPETAVCPWCGTASLGAVCDGCGQRKLRYSVEPEREAARIDAGGTVSCPSCFARVAADARCSDCGTPFPVQEL